MAYIRALWRAFLIDRQLVSAEKVTEVLNSTINSPALFLNVPTWHTKRLERTGASQKKTPITFTTPQNDLKQNERRRQRIIGVWSFLISLLQ